MTRADADARSFWIILSLTYLFAFVLIALLLT